MKQTFLSNVIPSRGVELGWSNYIEFTRSKTSMLKALFEVSTHESFFEVRIDAFDVRITNTYKSKDGEYQLPKFNN